VKARAGSINGLLSAARSIFLFRVFWLLRLLRRLRVYLKMEGLYKFVRNITTITMLSSPPSDTEQALAQESSRQLATLIPRYRLHDRVSLLKDDTGREVIVPTAALNLLLDILTQMAQGNAITLIPHHAELTTQEAADLLNVSRPFLVKLLESREIGFRYVGKHRRVLLQDILKYKENIDRARNETLNELVAQAQELNMGYQ
jgi:excisionase family DNA binding protein